MNLNDASRVQSFTVLSSAADARNCSSEEQVMQTIKFL